MGAPVPWIWSDDLARALVRAEILDPKQAKEMLERPTAVSISPDELLAQLADADDEDADQHRAA